MDFSQKLKRAPVTLQGRITAALDTAIVEHDRAEYEAGRGSGKGDVAKKRIGAGYIGEPCGRALAYKYHKANKDERDSVVSPGELQRHALSGHWTESSMAEWFRLAGFNLATEKSDGSGQYGFKVAADPVTGQFRIAGEIDGIFLASPVEMPLPCLWESKKATNKKWKRFSKDGVAVSDPKYYGQVQTNMAYLNVGHTLFTMLNLDNMKIYCELIEFDEKEAQRLTDRALKILDSQTAEEQPRITRDRSDFRCKFCDYASLCWEEKATTIKETPKWISKS